jgi:hypothetical protein
MNNQIRKLFKIMIKIKVKTMIKALMKAKAKYKMKTIKNTDNITEEHCLNSHKLTILWTIKTNMFIH